MKRLSKLLLLAVFSVNNALAQGQVSIRQQTFPTEMPTDDVNIEWQRTIYREVNLMDEENYGLYCPQEQTENQKGLFLQIFNLAVKKHIPIYRYVIDGDEDFNEDSQVDINDILTNHHIYFEEEDGQVFVDEEDIPSAAVMAYYIKEGVFYDQTNSTFRRKVEALCPVLVEDDEFSEGHTRYPLFWVRYKDVEPFLKNITIIPNWKNSARTMSLTDFFTRNMYKGDIYKVANALGRTLRQMVDSDSALVTVQQQIENEIRNVRRKTYNTYYSPAQTTKKDKPVRQRRTMPSKNKETTKDDSEK